MSHLIVRTGALIAALAFLWGSAGAFAVETTSDKSAVESTKPRVVGVVNVNTATPEQLGLLPGVGPARALAIVEQRKKQDGFKKLEDLTQIKGIGEKALEKIRPHAALEGKTTARITR
ncbi:MAG: helix-hairpin-helix domain-containing protein [bacterium]|nr:helix-hairpin-helix domain-containing protein [bacterium]